MPWMVAAAALTVGGSLISSSNASHAADKAAQVQEQGAAAATAEQRREFDLIQSQTAPARQIGSAALGAIGSSFGLPGYGNGVSMTGASGTAPDPYYGYSVSTAPGSMTGQDYTDRAIALPPGVTMTAPKNADTAIQEPASVGPPVTSPQSTAQTPAATQAPDWQAFANDPKNADILQWAQSGHGDPNIPIDQQPLEQRVAYWYSKAQREGDPRAAGPPPMKAVTPAATGPGGAAGPAPGYTDPTAPNGYMVGPRPNPGPSPSPYVASARPMTAPLDVSLSAYQKSPGLDFQMSEAQKALGNIASANGSVYSGARLKAASDRAQQMALGDYTDWRNYTTGQFNVDRSRGDQIYSEDRQFGYGQARDARGDYVNDRTRSDGLYQDDRAYTAGRSDTRNNQLMSLAGFGQNANNTSANSAQSFATQAGNNLMTAANAKANGYINSANAFTSGINNLTQTGAYLAGQYMTGGGFGSPGVGPGGTISFTPGVR